MTDSAVFAAQLAGAAAGFLIGLLCGWGWIRLKSRLGCMTIKVFGSRGSHSHAYLVGALGSFLVLIPAVAALVLISMVSVADPAVIAGSFVAAYIVVKFASKERS